MESHQIPWFQSTNQITMQIFVMFPGKIHGFSGHHTVGKFFSDGPHIKWPSNWSTPLRNKGNHKPANVTGWITNLEEGEINIYPLVMTNIAMENEPFVDDVPIKMVISMAMLNNQRVYIYISLNSLMVDKNWVSMGLDFMPQCVDSNLFSGRAIQHV